MTDDTPLFQDMDERERELAPEEVPGTREHAERTRRDDDTTPLIPVRGDTSQNQPIPLPAQTADAGADAGTDLPHDA